MDFHSLTRRELQSLCKSNKIPANTTNIAMADALKALEIVEGIEEFLKSSESETAQYSIESPDKTMITSPTVTRTGCRTSTRRKTMKEEPESSQTLTKTRRGTRRTIAAEVEEAKTDVPETPAMPTSRKRAPAASARRKMETQFKESEDDQKNGDQMVQLKKDVPDTPAIPISRRRGTVASARRRMETNLRIEKQDESNGGMKEESSVLRVYSTRRSVRLSEKKMVESNLNEKERTEAIKIDSFSEEMPKDFEAKSKEGSNDLDEVSEDTGMSGVDSLKISEVGSEGANDSEVFSGQKLNVLSENEREFDGDDESKGDSYQVDDWNEILEEVSEVFDEMDVVAVSDEHPNKSIIEKDRDVKDEVHDESKGVDSQTKSEVGSEICDESDILLEKFEKALDTKDEVLGNKGSDDSAVDKLFPSDAENPNELLKLETGEESKADKDMGSEDSAAVGISEDVCGDEIDLVAQSSAAAATDMASEDPARTDLDSLNLSASAADEDKKEDTKLELASEEEFNVEASSDDAETDPELYGIQYLELKFTTEEDSNGKVSGDGAEAHSDLSECIIGSKQLDSDTEPKTPHIIDCEESKSGTNQLIMGSNNVIDLFSGEKTVDKELDAEKSVTEDSRIQVPADFSHQESMICYDVKGSCRAQEPMLDMEAGVDVHEDMAEEPDMTTTHACPPSLDETPVSVEQISAHPLISKDNVTDQFTSQENVNFGDILASCHIEDPEHNIQKSPEAAQVNATTHELPRWSLDKTSASVRQSSPSCLASVTPRKKSSSKTPTKMTHVLDDNKENIDNSGKKLVTREKEKNKKKSTAEDDNRVKLNEASLRQLAKMLKEKLQITNNNEEKNIAKKAVASARARPALQTLSENLIATGEAEKEN